MTDHAALIHSFYDAFGRRDYAAMADCYHPSVHFSDPAALWVARRIGPELLEFAKLSSAPAVPYWRQERPSGKRKRRQR